MILWVVMGCSPSLEPASSMGVTPTRSLPAATGDTGEGMVDPWVQVTQAPCGLTASGRLECWTSQAWPIPADANLWESLAIDDPQGRFDRIWALNAGTVWGLTKSGRTRRSMCGTALVRGGGEAPWCDVPEPDAHDFVAIAHSAGLTEDGRLIDWADGEQPMSWYPQERSYVKLAFAWANVALDSQNVLHYGGVDGSHTPQAPQPASYAFAPDRGILEISSWQVNMGCVLDADGGVSCVDRTGLVNPQPFVTGPYQRIRGNFGATCAQRVDHVIECNDGETYDFGPLRDFAVSENRYLTYDQGGVLSLELCVLTGKGAFRCVGERYAPDLQAKLPTGDPEIP